LLTDDPQLAKRIDSAVFPGTQGSLHPNVIAAKAVCLGEALEPAFRAYAAQVVENAHALAEVLAARGLGVIAGGTDTHIVLADVSPCGLTGDRAEKALEAAHITSNKNPAPGDPPNPSHWRGVRLGTAAGTTRGLDASDFRQLGEMIADVWRSAGENGEPGPGVLESVRGQVGALCARYPVYDA
jgi:glycine hydroxymethyltransferase